jgi:hypothetical protein
MCSACGLLRGSVDWIEGVTDDQEALHKRLAQRRRRVALGVRLSEHGHQLVVRAPCGRRGA